MTKHLPNFITCLNLLSGCCAIVFAFNARMDMSAYMVAASLILDFADGLVARLLHVQSKMGQQLDSLADVISFGAVPGVIVYQLLQASLISRYDHNQVIISLLPFIGFVIT